MPAPLPRTVKALGAVSLLTDASSEMIYPLLPAFVTGTLAAGPAFLGAIEGVAEATASLLKLVSGRLSDRLPRRKPLVLLGYGLSSVVRPLVGLATAPWHVLAVRFLDRFGKGTRGAPHDALVADVTPAEARGRAFGFHRAMDHTGAVLGPLLASALLLVLGDLRTVFLLAAVPAAACMVVLALSVREEARRREPVAAAPPGVAPASPAFKRYLLVLALFAFGNSSDVFLLLRAQDAGVALAAVPLLWSFHHVVKAATSTWAGTLSDRFGRRRAIVAGWGVYALAYAGFAVAAGPLATWVLFAVYGLYHAATEGPERALVADLAGPEAKGRAFGLYHAVTGAMLLPGNLVTGWLWQAHGAATALGLGATCALAASIGLFCLVPETSGAGPSVDAEKQP
jgi:MFS family permease